MGASKIASRLVNTIKNQLDCNRTLTSMLISAIGMFG